MTTAPTRSHLLAHIAELESQLAAIQAPSDTLCDELQQTLWLNDRYAISRTSAGRMKISFSAQKSVKNRDGGRAYGAFKGFVAYGDIAETCLAIFTGNDRLVDVTAFESPWNDNSKRSDWVVTSIAPRERKPQPEPLEQLLEDPTLIDEAELPAAPFSAEPSLDEILF